MFTSNLKKTLELFLLIRRDAFCKPTRKHPHFAGFWSALALSLLTAFGLYSPWAQAIVPSGQWVTQDHLSDLVDPAMVPKDGTVQVQLTKDDARLSNGECPAALFSNTRGNRMWGRTFVQVQCVGSDQAPFYVGVDVKVWAPVLVVKSTIQAGQPITSDEVQYRTMDLTELQTGWVSDISHLQNKTATRQLFPGTLLRQDYFKGIPLIKVGDTVKILVKGPGFQIGGSGIAMETAERGDVVRVKTAQGKILNGVAVDPLVVEVSL